MGKKISEDEIKWTLSVNSSKAQQDIHQFTLKNKALTASNKELRKAMLDLVAQGKKNSAEYNNLSKAMADNNAKIKANNVQIKALESSMGLTHLTMNQLSKKAKELQYQLNNTSKATNPQQYAALQKELSATRARMDELRGAGNNIKNSLKNAFTSNFSLGVMVGSIYAQIIGWITSATSKLKDFANEGIKLSSRADGVKRSFEALNKPFLLDDLRKATKGTITDFKLMQDAVTADKFHVPMSNLAKYFEFARVRARDMGKDVNELVESMITGIGRSSPRALAALGVSTVEMKKEIKSAGSYTQALANIIDRELNKAQTDYVSATEKAAKRTAELENKQEELGQILRPVKGEYVSFMQTIKIGLANAIIWVAQHRDSILTIIKAVTAYYALVKLGLVVQKTWNALMMTAKAINIANSAVMALQSGNLARNAAAMRLYNASVNANNILVKAGTAATYLFAAAKAYFTGNVEKAKIAYSAFNSVVKVSPIGIITTMLGLAAAALVFYYDNLKKARSEEAAMNNVRSAAKASIVEEKTKLELLWKTAENDTISRKKRLAAIQEINKISPKYLGDIDLETIKTDKARKAKDKYLQSLLNQAMAEAAYNKIVEIQKKIIEKTDNSQSWTQKLGLDKLASIIPGNTNFAKIFMLQEAYMASQNVKDLNKELSNYVNIYNKTKVFVPTEDNTPTFGDGKGKKDKTDYNAIALKDLETEHEEELNKIKLHGQEKEETEEEINKKVLESDIAYYGKRIAKLEEFSKKEKDKKKQSAYDNEVVQLKSKQLTNEIELEKQKISSIEKLHQKDLDDQDKIYKANQTALSDALSENKITKDQYDMLTLSLEIANTENRLEVERQFLSDMNMLEVKNGKLKVEAVDKANDAVIAADLANAKARSTQQQKLNDLVKDFKSEFKLTTVGEDLELQMKVLESRYQASKDAAIKDHLDTAELDKSYARAKENLTQDSEYRINQIRNQYGLLSQKQQFDLELQQLKQHLKDQTLTQKQYEKAVQNLKRDSYKKQFDYYSGLFSGAVNALQQSEMDNVDAKYDAEIAAAKGNTEEVERLENEKEQKKLDVQKKYADINFAIKASQIVADTAVSIMKAYADLGPIAGTVAAALLGITGIAQLASANAEREKIKKMTVGNTSSSSSSSGSLVATGAESGGSIDVTRAQDGKKFPNSVYDPSARGFIDRPTVIVGEGPTGQSKEWVASNAAVNNPTIYPILSVIDKAQQAGTIRTLDLTKIIRARAAGYESGGSIGKQLSQSVASSPSVKYINSIPNDTLEKLVSILDNIDKNGVTAGVYLTEFEQQLSLRDRARKIGSK